jgi:GNAT superfamily N-acetyltransferase
MRIRPMKETSTTALRKVKTADIQHPQLCERVKPDCQAEHTELFVATNGSAQVGLLSLDFPPPPQPLELYEVFVVSGCRNQGIGSFLLEQAEIIGRRRGYRSITLKPHPLDSEQRQEYLVEWYGRRGYSWDSSVPGFMSKVL